MTTAPWRGCRNLSNLPENTSLKICSIEALIKYRREREKLVEKVEIVEMPTEFGDFKLHLYRSALDDQHHLALVMGEVESVKNVMVRVHSECLTGDVFGSLRCDCGSQLAPRHATGRPRWRRGDCVYATGRSRHWARSQNACVQITGKRIGHRGG